jgi:hypothetical protein
VNEETHSPTVAPCEPVALVLNLSTTPASLEQLLVEPVAEFPLLQDDYKTIPCDKETLCDHASLMSPTQLVHGHDNCIPDDTHAEVRRVHCINSEEDELQIISSFNCLGYIEFDLSYDLNCFEDDLFGKLVCIILVIVLFMHLVYMTITIATFCRRYIFVQI